MSIAPAANPTPLQSLDEVEDFYKERYPEPMTEAQKQETQKKPSVGTDPEKKTDEFRNYEADARPTVREFYRLNHSFQTYDFALAKRKEYLGLNRRQMSIWRPPSTSTSSWTIPIPTPISRS